MESNWEVLIFHRMEGQEDILRRRLVKIRMSWKGLESLIGRYLSSCETCSGISRCFSRYVCQIRRGTVDYGVAVCQSMNCRWREGNAVISVERCAVEGDGGRFVEWWVVYFPNSIQLVIITGWWALSVCIPLVLRSEMWYVFSDKRKELLQVNYPLIYYNFAFIRSRF